MLCGKRVLPGALATVLLAATLASGERAPDGPLAQMRVTTDAILKILKDETLKGDAKESERRVKINAVVDARFHWQEMAMRSLGRHWRRRSDKEREAFANLYAELVRYSYMGQVEGYSGEKIRYKDERVEGKYARVSVEIVRENGTEIPVVYSMKQEPDAWRVYDVTIEGVRLVSNYRSQFNSMLSRMSFGEFMKKLEEKVQNQKADD